FIYIPALIIYKTDYIRGKIKRKTVWLRQTEIHLPPTAGLRPSHARGRRILSGNSLKGWKKKH
ncbi:hypothetical protein DN396_28345, partial [Bacillus sp. BF9-10]